jgi:hypothetical protein
MRSTPDSDVVPDAAETTARRPLVRPDANQWLRGFRSTVDGEAGVLVRCVVIIAVAMVIGAALGALFHVIRPSTWTASIGMRVTGNVASLVDPQQPSAPGRRDVLSEVDLMKSAPVSQHAQEATGRTLPPLQVTSGVDSDVVTMETDGSTAEAASAAVETYAEAYESMLSDQQRRVLTDERNRLSTLNTQYTGQIDQLSGQLANAPPATLAAASAVLTPLTEGLADSSRRLSRIDALLGGLPANTERLQAAPVARETTSSWTVDAAAGAVLAGAGTGLVLYRRYRPRLT